MSAAAPAASEPAWRRHARGAGLHFGLQLAVAVVAAYATSSLLGLPENFWAVMSALIVVRPTTGSSLGVGWQRVQGTVLGALFALAGVWLHRVGIHGTVATLAIVGGLAFGSAMLPALRSAPITALIVLGGAATAAHSAQQVALLRVLEISIGVGVGLVVSLLGGGARAAARFDADCAAILRRMALDVGALLAIDPLPAPEREAKADAARAALRELAVLAEGADREERWFRSRRQAAVVPGANAELVPRRHRSAARLLARMAHDVALFGRLAGAPSDAAPRVALVEALRRALISTAELLEGRGTQDLQLLRDAASQGGWTPVAVKLLMQDLIALAMLRE